MITSWELFRDLLTYSNPVNFYYRMARKALLGRRVRPEDSMPGGRDPELIAQAARLFDRVGRYYFRYESRHIHNVPAQGPALLVGNHNGGLHPMDSFLLLPALVNAYGAEREAYGLGHDVVYDDDMLRKYMRKLGALRAGHESAERVFESGGLLLVYPGSDLDSFRPFRERHRICLGGRTGFIRLVLRTGVPIVPVVSVGAHETFFVLTRGDRMAEILRFKKYFRSNVFPIALSLPWGLTSGYLPYIPLPSKIVIEFGPPIEFHDYGPESAEDEEVIGKCYREVEKQMQSILDRLAAERRFPVLG